ncbi:MAG: hypothetical protein AAB531_01815 [Patescibacteria group bacterium]
MVTVPEAARKIVMRSRYLSEAMSKRIINNSSLARYIKPEIEEMLLKEVSNSAIIMALQRMSSQIKPKYFKGNIFKTPPQIIVRSSLESGEMKDLETEGFKLTDLSSITIGLSKEAVKTPGILYFFIKSLAWEGINIISISSSTKDVTLIFEKKDINRAFNIIQSLFFKSG